MVSVIAKIILEVFIREKRKKPIIFAGLKSDRLGRRQVDFQEAERTAEAYSAPYIESSAKDNINIEETFELVLTQIYKQDRRKSRIRQQNI